MKSKVSRRLFIGVAGALSLSSQLKGEKVTKPAVKEKCRILRLFLGNKPSWPNPKMDMKKEVERFKKEMGKVAGLDDIEFVGDVNVKNGYEAGLYIKHFKDKVVGVLACNLCLGTMSILKTIVKSGLPTVVFAIPYSGHEWYSVPDIWRAKYKVDIVATSDFDDLLKAVKPLRAIWGLKRSKILYFGGGLPIPKNYIKDVKEKIGPEIITCDYKIVKEAYDSIDNALVLKEADRWIKEAEKVVEPTREEIIKSSRVYLALKKLLKEKGAEAVTINCLGGFYSHVPAYPCFAFSRLNDEGLCGVCEADIASTVTQLIFLHLEGVPGFVNDPVVDTSRNTLIYAHCVSATRMDGPSGPACPYIIRNHLEDLKSASLQVRMRNGQPVTVAKLISRDKRPFEARPFGMAATPQVNIGVEEMLIGRGKIVDSPTIDRGCRTKVEVRVDSAQKMLEGWTAGLHRVLFYGDHMEDIHRLSRLLKFKVTEEGIA